MRMGSDGIARFEADHGGERYFIDDGDGTERETDAAGFIALERSCGFRHKPGCGPFAITGFSSGARSGRIQSHAREDAETNIGPA